MLQQLVDRNGLDPAQIDDVIGGCVTQAGEQAANITRSAVFAAGLLESVPATTVDRRFGSSQPAAAFTVQGVVSGFYDTFIAASAESMSRAPISSAVQGRDLYGTRIPARYPDGLVTQGISAEIIAARWKFDRQRWTSSPPGYTHRLRRRRRRVPSTRRLCLSARSVLTEPSECTARTRQFAPRRRSRAWRVCGRLPG